MSSRDFLGCGIMRLLLVVYMKFFDIEIKLILFFIFFKLILREQNLESKSEVCVK